MCHRSVVDFVEGHLSRAEVEGRRVLEVGARNVNGSVRPFLLGLGAAGYVGADIEAGPGVDRVCEASRLPTEFGDERFGLVITTEMLEHVRVWPAVIDSLKEMVAPGGLLVITTRSIGFPYHEYPGDFWRYELSDMRHIFRDFDILALVRDPGPPGVFFKGRRPAGFHHADVSTWKLHSMVRARRALPDEIVDADVDGYARRMGRLLETVGDFSANVGAVDIADVGQGDFSHLWRRLEHLSDRIGRLGPGRSGSSALSRAWRRLLDGLAARRLARGRSFAWARSTVLTSVARELTGSAQKVPWADVEEQPFQEILGDLVALRGLGAKIRTYARPALPS